MQRLQLPIIAVGCCPSSGSTLLADLLDSVPGLLCGPELNILCVERAYRYDNDFKREALNRSAFPLASATSHCSRFFNSRYLAQVGL
ncbi:MAG: sulfotransferase, partial [Pseudomonadota bacterium]|nr:sulfotransferase [Pseudomonadota bacterium]